MSRFDHDRVMEILDGALQLPEPHRCGFLDSTCAGDPDLRREVEELLHYAPDADATFDAASDVVRRGGEDPDQIGCYRILEPIGEGGMAVVYKAEQQRPVRRTVALKLIKLGMDTRQFVARFESERQALAMMDHPNVARVFDAGSTDTGRPYFVMEYVPGRPILDYCDGRALDTRRRLELFTAVCEAVEHAHRKGIIHRDIKNSNVLVTEVDGKPVPKVIDFGVAKAVEHSLTDRTLQTEQGQLIGTPEYMSPEQAERGSADVDTRSDVYSLGVLLYELIAGVQPIAPEVLRDAGYEQVLQLIRNTDTPRPSARVGKLSADDADRVARRRGTQAHALVGELRAELEWIPLKAMRKDREQRYRSAAELADDVRNYLGARPLIAGPESTRYKLRKFLRRHKAGVAASAAMVLLLLGGIAATTVALIGQSRARAEAEQERESAQATLDFLTDDVLSGAQPFRIRDAAVRDEIIRAMIAPAATRAATEFRDRPLTEASVRGAIARTLREIGRADLALPHAEAALALLRDHRGEDHEATLGALSNYAIVLADLGRAAEAEPLQRQALARRRLHLGPDHPKTLASAHHLNNVLIALGRWADAEPLCREALQRHRRILGADAVESVLSLGNYAMVLARLERHVESEPLLRESLERHRRALGDDHPGTLTALNNFGTQLHVLGRTDEAAALYEEALSRKTRVYGPDHYETLQTKMNYATLLLAKGDAAGAERLLRQVLERQRATLGENHPESIRSMNHYGRVLTALDRLSEAEALLRDAVRRATNHPSLGATHPSTKNTAANHARTLDALGRGAEATAVRRHFGIKEPSTSSTTLPAAR